MGDIILGKLEEIEDVRSVWKDEARDFTPWLAQKEPIELLGKTLGLDINVESTESSVGDFFADIYATENNTGERIVIENQLEQTDHKHLGQIITYASGKDASYVIWIVEKAKEEHRAAISWLNEHTDENIGFFLVEIKLYKIGDSQIAPQFVPIEIPNNWTKKTKNSSFNESQLFRFNYWTAFRDSWELNHEFSNSFNKVTPNGRQHYVLTIGEGRKAVLRLFVSVQRSAIGVEFYIENDKKLFDTLLHRKNEIESSTNINFEWTRDDDKVKSSKISVEKTAEIYSEDDWTNQFIWLMDTALKIKSTFLNYMI